MESKSDARGNNMFFELEPPVENPRISDHEAESGIPDDGEKYRCERTENEDSERK